MSPRTPEFNVENQNGGPNFADGSFYFARRVHPQIQAFPTLNLGGRGVGAAVMIWTGRNLGGRGVGAAVMIWTGSLFLCSSVGHGVTGNLKEWLGFASACRASHA